MKKIAIVLVIFFVLLGSARAKEGLSLTDCFQLALKQSETVRISEQEIASARAQYHQALGSVLPKISSTFTETLQDPLEDSDSDSSFSSTYSRLSRPEWALGVTQPLFQGLKEVHALRGVNAELSEQKYNLLNAKRLLYRDVAEVFFTVIKLQQDIKTAKQISEILRKHSGELKRQVDLGKSRAGEWAGDDAELALTEADLEQSRGDLSVAYRMLTFLTGVEGEPLLSFHDEISLAAKSAGADSVDTYSVDTYSVDTYSVDAYVAGVASRSDVLAGKAAARAAKADVQVSAGNFLPQVSATAHYYPYRVGFQKEIHWDAIFSVTTPLFDWENIGTIKLSKAQSKKAEWEAAKALRSAETEVRQAFTIYRSALKRYQLYQVAARKMGESYRFQEEDFRLGRINNLELLQVRRSWFDSLKERNQAEVEAKLSWAHLQVAAGLVSLEENR